MGYSLKKMEMNSYVWEEKRLINMKLIQPCRTHLISAIRVDCFAIKRLINQTMEARHKPFFEMTVCQHY